MPDSMASLTYTEARRKRSYYDSKVIHLGYIVRDVTRDLDEAAERVLTRGKNSGWKVQSVNVQRVTVRKEDAGKLLHDTGGSFRRATFTGRRLFSFDRNGEGKRTVTFRKSYAERKGLLATEKTLKGDSPGAPLRPFSRDPKGSQQDQLFEGSIAAGPAREYVRRRFRDRVNTSVKSFAMRKNPRELTGRPHTRKKRSYGFATAVAANAGGSAAAVYDLKKKEFTTRGTPLMLRGKKDTAASYMAERSGFAKGGFGGRSLMAGMMDDREGEKAKSRYSGFRWNSKVSGKALVMHAKKNRRGTERRERVISFIPSGKSGMVTAQIAETRIRYETRPVRAIKTGAHVLSAVGNGYYKATRFKKRYDDVMDGKAYRIITDPIIQKVRNWARDGIAGLMKRMAKTMMRMIGAVLKTIGSVLLQALPLIIGAFLMMAVCFMIFGSGLSDKEWSGYADYVIELNEQLSSDVEKAKAGGTPTVTVSGGNDGRLEYKGLFSIIRSFYGDDVGSDQAGDVLKWSKKQPNMYKITTKKEDGEVTEVNVRLTTFSKMKKNFTGGYESAKTDSEKKKALKKASQPYRTRIETEENIKQQKEDQKKIADQKKKDGKEANGQ